MYGVVRFTATVCCLLAAASVPARAVTFTVESQADEADVLIGDGLCASAGGACTLRAALQEANALPGADAIDVPAGMYRLSLGPGFAVDEDAAAAGDLDVTDDLTISGAGVGRTVLSAKKLDRVFHVLSPATVEISGVTIRDGLTHTGAGIWNLGTLTLRAVDVTKNRAADHYDPAAPTSCSGDGAGIENDGTLTMLDSSIDSNRGCASDYSRGGGLQNVGTAQLTNVTVSRNRAHTGGGIINWGALDLTNVTLVRNAAISPFTGSTAGMGGGLMNGGTAHLVNVTVTLNRANNRPYNGGGGVDNRLASTALVTFKNSIVAHNARYDCSGNPSFLSDELPGLMVSLGHNLRGYGCPILAPSGDPLPGGDRDAGDPMLGPGPHTFPPTLALKPGSPAIDAGDDTACPATDARGVPRPQDGNGDSVAVCDIGSYEAQP